MKTFVASKNDGKLRELRDIFAGSPFELDIYPRYPDVEETADNYAQNAMLKARALFAQLRADGLRAAVLADDSGIEVDALDGRPGVLSARYAPGATWAQRLDMLLAEVGDRPENERGATFVCAMTLILPDERVIEGYGDVSGHIARSTSGASGFGYDPVFFYPPIGKTFAQILESEKNLLSHRYNAAQALLRAYARL